MSTLDPDPVTPWADTAADILDERQQRESRRRWPTATIRLSDPATASQILAKYGLTRETVKRRTRLLAQARRGDPEARRRLRRLYGCVVYQRPEVRAWER